MKPSKLKIKIKNQSYNVIIGQNLIKNFSEILSANSIDFKKCLLVVDNKVPKKFLKKITFTLKKKKNLFIFLIQAKSIKTKKVSINY